MKRIADQLMTRISKKKRTTEEEEETANSPQQNSQSGNPCVVVEWTIKRPLEMVGHVGIAVEKGRIIKRSDLFKPATRV